MEEFQLECMKLPYSCLRQWYWYVDDSELKCEESQAEDILDEINKIKKDVIVFTMEKQQDDTLAVLDLKQTIDRRTKRIKFDVYYKPTHTNLNVRSKSNHPETMKRGIQKGFAERARALCDEENLEKELKNIEDVFVANGYDRGRVHKTLREGKQQRKENDNEKVSNGKMVIPYVAGLSEEYKRLAKSKGFDVYFTPGIKLRTISKTHQTPLANKKSNAVYKINCKCQKATYTGETRRRFETRLSEHQATVRLTEADIQTGNKESAEQRMGRDDGGIARHSVDCAAGIDWEGSRVVGIEADTRKRKVLEGIESLKSQHSKKRVLNNHEQLHAWRGLMNEFFDGEQHTSKH